MTGLVQNGVAGIGGHLGGGAGRGTAGGIYGPVALLVRLDLAAGCHQGRRRLSCLPGRLPG